MSLVVLITVLAFFETDFSSVAYSGPAAAAHGSVPPGRVDAGKMYQWPRRNMKYEPMSGRFPTPDGFKRVAVERNGYAYWLRHLPLLPAGTEVRDYRGNVLKSSSRVSAAVVDLDTGKRDLQQCIDTIMRLRAEYFWWKGEADRTFFRYAGGKYVGWKHWRAGLRPEYKDRKTVFRRSGAKGASRKNFESFMTFMFAMTGTMHHVREPRVAFENMQAGDFFIHSPPRPGSLGHAVVILDLARCPKGRVKALIGQGYTPAQDLHVLKTPEGKDWYELNPDGAIPTPLWPVPFKWKDLARFRY